MKTALVRVGKHIVNMEHVADAKWEGDSLFVHFYGGAFAQFRGREAQLVWAAIDKLTVNLETGEVKA
jgi:hypothetical protein